jgi:hypothetical protein
MTGEMTYITGVWIHNVSAGVTISLIDKKVKIKIR